MITAIIPALDEEGAIGAVVSGLRERCVDAVIVADNGSRDATVAVAIAAGATVIHAPRRGYGSACLAGLAALPAPTTVVVFCDGDGADDLDRLVDLITPVVNDEVDLMIGSRVLGHAEPGALTPPQRMGNWVAARLLRCLFGVPVSDLGPFRCIRRSALDHLGMADPAFGWTAEMQTKVLRLGMRYREIPVDARLRRAGASKISGCVIPVIRAGWAILTTILRYRFAPLPATPIVAPTLPG